MNASVGQRMNVLVTGASGLVGRALTSTLRPRDTVREVTRTPRAPHQCGWDGLDVRGMDAVVHLAGEPVAQRWTPAVREAIRSSRLHTTEQLVEAIDRLPRSERPKVLIVASGVAIYGPNAEADERSPLGSSYLAEVARVVETTARFAEPLGVRVTRLRIGQVVAPPGQGAPAIDAALRIPFVGPGRIGSGEQVYSWISLRDLVRMIVWALGIGEWSGAVNAVAPNPLTQAEFARVVCKVARRVALPALPARAVQGLLGTQAAEEVVLTGQCVRPAGALRRGFWFEDETLERALRQVKAREVR